MTILPARIALALIVLFTFAGSAAAEGRNDYGKQGRTVVSGSVWGFRTNVDRQDNLDHDATRSGGGSLRLAHFWIDNLAVGASVSAQGESLDDLSRREPAYKFAGGQLLMIGHVPLNPRLSLQFWGRAGMSFRRYRTTVFDEELALEVYRAGTQTWVTGGLEGNLLIHLSPSVALVLGPWVNLSKPVRGGGSLHVDWGLGPRMNYSFGPDESGKRRESAKQFGQRGKRLFTLSAPFSKYAFRADAAFARFVRQGIAVGGYGGGGLGSRSYGYLYDVTFGAQALFDLPVASHVSVLLQPRVGWSYRYFDPTLDGEFAGEYRESANLFELALGAYACMHLFEGLVVGVGPYARAELQLRHATNGRYVQGGVASMLAASF